MWRAALEAANPSSSIASTVRVHTAIELNSHSLTPIHDTERQCSVSTRVCSFPPPPPPWISTESAKQKIEPFSL